MEQIFSLTIPNDTGSIPIVCAAIREVAARFSLSGEDSYKLELAVEEASSNVICRAYEPGQKATYTIECFIEMGKLVVRVKDRGLPYDPFHVPKYDPANPESPGLGSYLMERCADSLRFVNLGLEGKAFDIIKNLPFEPREESSDIHRREERQECPTLSIRRFQPEDAGQVARCAYRVYGYSYLGEHLYVPERLIRMNESGELLSVVAVTEQGEVFGHAALMFEPQAAIPQCGQAFVMPSARGGGVFQKLKLALVDIAKERGIDGIYSQSTSVHPYTQRANLDLGAKETAVTLAFGPESLDFKSFGKNQINRQAIVTFYLSLRPSPEIDVFAPLRHAEMIRGIYEGLGRRVRYMNASAAALPAFGEIEVECLQNWGMAFLKVLSFGEDTIESVKAKLHQLNLRKIAATYLDLPLDSPSTQLLAPALEELRFSFSGIIPGYFGCCDTLRFQYLNNVEVNVAEIKTASQFGEQLRDYVLSVMAE